MNKIFAFFKKYATLRNAFIAFVVLEIVAQILHRFDLPLLALSSGEGKLDLNGHYDVSTVVHLFDAYDQRGRALYAWDLLVDMFYPALLSLSAILFTLAVIRHSLLGKLLITFPLICLATDILQNLFFLGFLWSYPSVSTAAVTAANLVARLKLFTMSITTLEGLLFMLMAVAMYLVGKLKAVVRRNAVV